MLPDTRLVRVLMIPLTCVWTSVSEFVIVSQFGKPVRLMFEALVNICNCPLTLSVLIVTDPTVYPAERMFDASERAVS